MMLRRVFASFACAAIALSPAVAQQASRTTDDYVCTFAGQCDDEGADAADTETPAARTPGAPRSSSARGFSLARPNGASTPSAAARKAGTRPPPQKQATASAATVRRTPPAAPAGQRADLRLSFETGSATLTPVARAEAKVFAESLLRPELRSMKFVIEGHTDSVGNRDYNIDLSRRRAQSVADYLVSQGVARDRLDIRGYGFDRPLPGTSAAAQQNRRVEAVRVS